MVFSLLGFLSLILSLWMKSRIHFCCHSITLVGFECSVFPALLFGSGTRVGSRVIEYWGFLTRLLLVTRLFIGKCAHPYLWIRGKGKTSSLILCQLSCLRTDLDCPALILPHECGARIHLHNANTPDLPSISNVPMSSWCMLKENGVDKYLNNQSPSLSVFSLGS